MKSRSRFVAAAALAIVLIAGEARAQTVSAQAAASPASAERLRLARAVFEAQGGIENITAAMDRAMGALQRGEPSTGEAADAARRIGADVVKQALPQIMDIEAHAYAETFDEQQLRYILAFYQSPTGQVMRAKLPELSEKTGQGMARLMPAITLKILEQVCAQTTCTAQQLKALQALKQAPPPSLP